MLKYKLTDETIEFEGKTLYRIEALKDFNDVKKGDRGGFIEHEGNLSYEGDCWIYDDAKVFGRSVIGKSAEIRGNSVIINSAVCWTTCVTNSEINKSFISCERITNSILENVTMTGMSYINDSTITTDISVEYSDTEIDNNVIICRSDYEMRFRLDNSGVVVDCGIW